MTIESQGLAPSQPTSLLGIKEEDYGAHSNETDTFWGGFQQEESAYFTLQPMRYVLCVNGKRFTEEECRPHVFRKKQSWVDVYSDLYMPVTFLPKHPIVTDPMLARFGDCLSIREDFHKAIAHVRNRLKKSVADQEPHGKPPASQRDAGN